MFDADFYRTFLPGWVLKECREHPGDLPVVKLYLANGTVLDLCHIVSLADSWFSVQYFREAETCTDMDIAFLPYELVTFATVSLHHPSSRRMGFNITAKPSLSGVDKEKAGQIT